MVFILNLNTKEYFIVDNEIEQKKYLKKLLNYKPPTLSLDWKCNSTYTSFKSVIRWNKTDKIIFVPTKIEQYIFENKNYQQISMNYSGKAQF